MGGETAAKICVVCKQDCSTKPRQRDAQGRYTCKECADRGGSKAAKPVPAKAKADADPALAAALSGVDQSRRHPCPGCSVLLPPDAVICTSCGFNVAAGKSLHTRVSVEKAAKERGDFKLPISWDIIAGIMIALILATGAFAFFSPAGVIPFWIALALNSLIIGLMVVIIPFQDKQNAWGVFNLGAPFLAIAMIVGGGRGTVPCLGVILFMAFPWVILYYVFKVNWRDSLKRLYLAGMVGGFVLGALAAAHGPEKVFSSIGLELKDEDEAKGARPARAQPEQDGSLDGGTEDP